MFFITESQKKERNFSRDALQCVSTTFPCFSHSVLQWQIFEFSDKLIA